MLEIRQGIFETNSSSCHKLIVPYGEELSVPKTVDLDNVWPDGMEFLVDVMTESWGNCDDWVQFLYSHGVEEFKYSGSNTNLRTAIKKYKGTMDYRHIPMIGSAQNSDCCPAIVILTAIFSENTIYQPHGYSDEAEPEELDGKHFVFIW